MSAGVQQGGGGGGVLPSPDIGEALRQVVPGRLDTYERLLGALAGGRVWMLLWQGSPGSPAAQYGNMEVGGLGYAPAVTSPDELAASGWNREHDVADGRAVADSLFRNRYGLWLDPHRSDGGVGIPWLDLRRIAGGLDRLPAGPLEMAEPSLQAPEFYERLTAAAHAAGPVRALRQAWVTPALGEPYLAVGVELDDPGPAGHEAVRAVMAQSVDAAPAGFAVATVLLEDEYDPVAMWMRQYAPPLFDRAAAGPPPQPGPGYGYPPPVAAEQQHSGRPGYGFPHPQPPQQQPGGYGYPR